MHSYSFLATMGWETGTTWSHHQDAGLGGYIRKRVSATDWPLSNCFPQMILTQVENSQTKRVWRIIDSKRFYLKEETMTLEHFLQSCFVLANHEMVNSQLFLSSDISPEIGYLLPHVYTYPQFVTGNRMIISWSWHKSDLVLNISPMCYMCIYSVLQSASSG